MMAKIIKKSWRPLFFTIIVFGTIAGGISMILSVEEQMSNRISNNTYVLSINPNEVETSVTNQDLLAWLQQQTTSFTFYKNMPQEASRLSFSNEGRPPYNVAEGEAYINAWYKDDQTFKNGKNYYYFDGKEYEVVGYLENYTDIVASIVPSLEANPNASLTGEYFLDAGKNSAALIHNLSTTLQEADKAISLSFEKVESNWIRELFNQKFALFIFIGTSALLFVSGFTIVLSWIEKYKREMFVRRLSGASETRLLLRVYLQMLGIRFIGVLFASGITILITNICNLLPYQTVFRWESIVVGVLIFFIIDVLYTFPMLFINQKKQLIKIMR
ncbi:hypothetical protein Pryu01_02783 [Paraliobacillus ryukyuensis]|uniref:FtsX-like permease family protein n=1 Tax=Paraliobacillus ryukyuensis TaxID=200904 RepID=A0A366DSY3_9BACI|nr:ABC transporter permease [Paraliobacillus ryukyuensis]RBO93207.1 hypothetical protein DES48_1128 [Paraliobacillus ryukyuensis]